MTGAGSGAADHPIGRFAVEVRSVNHRFLKTSLRTHGPLPALDRHVEEAIRRHVQRGHVTLHLRFTPAPGALTFPVLAAHCGPGLAVSDAEALRAMAAAFSRLKIVLEPGGAVALAAALFRGDALPGDAVIVVGSGGNVDAALYARALA